MSTITDAGGDVLSARFRTGLAERLKDHVGRLGWSRDRLVAHQRGQLRGLLACAIEGSPFHALRLAGVDPGIDVDVITDRHLNQPALSASLEQSLHSAGLVDPIVRVREVARIALDDRSGKVRRFIAL
jgi:hypothetical protein